MTSVAAYLVLVTALSGLACGHQGEELPLRVWRRLGALIARRGVLRALRAPQSPSRGSRDAGEAFRPPQRRTGPRTTRVPSWAHTEPYDYEETA